MVKSFIYSNGQIISEVEIDEPVKEFKTLNVSQFLGLLVQVLGFARVDQLVKKNKVIEALLLKADKVDRMSGNTPVAIACLKTSNPDPLTDAELTLIDNAWKSL